MVGIGPTPPYSAGGAPEAASFPPPPKNPTKEQAMAYLDKAIKEMPDTHKHKPEELRALRDKLAHNEISPDAACKKCYEIWKR